MALWQYSFFVLPKSDFQHLRFPEENDGFRTFDDDRYWRLATVPCSMFEEIAFFLPKGKSWSEKLNVYGDNDTTCLKVFCERDLVLSVSLRIDFTSSYEFILRELIQFFLRHDFILVDEDLGLVPLNCESIKRKIESSSRVSTYKRMSRG